MGDDLSSPTWAVRPVVPGAGGPADEVVVEVDGEPITVRARGARLADGPEAWAAALCIPAARAGARLELPGPVDARWLEGVQANIRDAASWWGGAPRVELAWPRLGLRDRATGLVGRRRPAPAPGRALCFTGGVDSFFSLLAGGHRPTHLLFVHGFDIDLDDTDRRARASAAVRAVATARGLVAIEVETDLRRHHRFASVSWEHTHGAALACIALLLQPDVGTLVIPPSYHPDRMVPWGSRPDLDARWSLPGRLTVEHGDAESFRIGRIGAIADDPLVHRHLRVCWEHLNGHLNCGRCEKCVRTMIVLESLGRLDACRTFPAGPGLAAAIDAMADPPPSIVPLWADLLDLPLAPEVMAALERLLARLAH